MPQILKIISAVILVFIFLNTKFDFGSKKIVRKNSIIIKVPDMTCQHCKLKISDTLKKVIAIGSFDIDLNNQEIRIDSDLIHKKIFNK